jgi:hypothetical protein
MVSLVEKESIKPKPPGQAKMPLLSAAAETASEIKKENGLDASIKAVTCNG